MSSKSRIILATTLFGMVASAGLIHHFLFTSAALPVFSNQSRSTTPRSYSALLQDLKSGSAAPELWLDCARQAKSFEERRELMLLAEQTKTDAGLRFLDELVADAKQDWPTRISACDSLSRVGKKGHFPGLLAARRGHPQLILAAAEALARTGSPRIGLSLLFNSARIRELRPMALQRLRRLAGDRYQLALDADLVQSSRIIDSWDSELDGMTDFTALPFASGSNKSPS